MVKNFNGKTVIITGGSRGIGAATANRFANAGANLVLVARGKKDLERTAEKLRLLTRVETIGMDVSDSEACINLFKKAEFEFGGVHVLINNAGVHARGLVENVAADDLGHMIDVNCRAPIILSRLAIPFIRQSGGGAIINVGSLAGRTPLPGSATYSATKAGLRAFTRALAEELAGSQIKVATISPGPVDTGFIMTDIDSVPDLTFSQPIITADEVAEEIFRLCLNDKVERAIPALSGFLTTITYLFTTISRASRPLLEKKGRRIKRKLKGQQRLAEEQAK